MNESGQIAGVLFGSGRGLTTGTHVGRVQQFLAEVSIQLPETVARPAKTELAGQPLTSLTQPSQSNAALGKPPDHQAVDDLPSMPALTLQVPPGLASEGKAVPRTESPKAPAAASLAAGPIAASSVAPIEPPQQAADSLGAGSMGMGSMGMGLPGVPAETTPPKPTRLVGNIPWLNPQGPWGETQAFLAFVTIVGVIFLISPRRGWAARDEEEE